MSFGCGRQDLCCPWLDKAYLIVTAGTLHERRLCCSVMGLIGGRLTENGTMDAMPLEGGVPRDQSEGCREG